MRVLFSLEELENGYVFDEKSKTKRKKLDPERVVLLKSKTLKLNKKIIG